MKGYLRATCNWSNPDVSVHRRHAAGVAAIPGLADAWHAGRLSRSQVDTLCRAWGNRRIRTQVVEHAGLLIDLAATMVYDEFTKALDTFVLLADPDGAEQHHRDNVDGRDVHVIDVNGLLHLAAHGGDPIVNGELAGIFQQFCDREFRIDADHRNPDGTLPRTGAQRRYDAFVELMRRAHASLTDHADDAPPPPAPAGSRARVMLNLLMSEPIMAAALAALGLAPADDLGRPLDPFTGAPAIRLRNLLDHVAMDPDAFAALRCETGTGTVVHPVRLLQAALAGHMRRVVIDSRVVPSRSRHRVDRPRAHRSRQRPTPLRPPQPLKHERGWKVAFDARGRPHTIRADGTPMTPVGADPPARMMR